MDIVKSILPEEPITVKRMLFLSIRYWLKGIYHLGAIMAISFVVIGFYDYLILLNLQHAIHTTLLGITTLVQAYIWAMSMYYLYYTYLGRKKSVSTVFKWTLSRFLRVVGYILALLFFGVVLYQFFMLVLFAMRHTLGVSNVLLLDITLIVAGVIYTVVVVASIVTIPVMLIEDLSLVPAIARSFRLSMPQWAKPFFAYLMIFIISCMMLLPQHLPHESITILGRLLVRSLIAVLLIPLMINVVLFCYNDLVNRMAKRHQEA